MKNYTVCSFLLLMSFGTCVSASPSKVAKDLLIAAVKRCKSSSLFEQVHQTTGAMIESGRQKLDSARQEILKKYAEISQDSIKTTIDSTQQIIKKDLPQSIAQGAKTDAVQNTSASLWAKSTVETTNNYYTTNNFAKKTVTESFFEWMQKGGQKRAAGCGLAVGSTATYVVMKQQQRVVYVPVEIVSSK
jgi:hypothetical protein